MSGAVVRDGDLLVEALRVTPLMVERSRQIADRLADSERKSREYWRRVK